jgi:plastocyanin
MKRVSGLVVLALVAALAGGLMLVLADNAIAATTTVVVGQTNGGGANGVNQYNAAAITITSGDTVTWNSAPDGRAHDVNSAVIPGGASAFSSAILDSDNPPATFSRTLTTTGTYTYFCSLHSDASEATLANVDANIAAGRMVGKITAQAPLPDTTAPAASAVAANPNPTNGSASITLTATITDSGTPLGTIASAQYRIDGGAPAAMSAADGTFNGSTENVTANVPVGALTLGNHTVEVRGTDVAGNPSAWVALAGGLDVTAPPAGAVQASVTVQGGNLTNTAQNVAFGSVALSGADQTVSAGAQTWQAKDARGTGDGWNVTVSSTNFTGAGAIDVANFKMRQLQTAITLVSGSAVPTSLVTTYQSLSALPLKVLQATGGAGMGTYDYIPDFQLTVPASAAAGAYTANVTVSVNTGP